MHNAWKSSVSKMHVSANGSGPSMYILVNLLGVFLFVCFLSSLLAMRSCRKKEKDDK